MHMSSSSIYMYPRLKHNPPCTWGHNRKPQVDLTVRNTELRTAKVYTRWARRIRETGKTGKGARACGRYVRLVFTTSLTGASLEQTTSQSAECARTVHSSPQQPRRSAQYLSCRHTKDKFQVLLPFNKVAPDNLLLLSQSQFIVEKSTMGFLTNRCQLS